MEQAFDVIVVGGGHAGCEAASAAARCGARTALVTMISAAIGTMSCNPAIGGIGKGHIVREIDVFDGVIAGAADAAAIHYRMLNRSKGSAVHGPRVQADRIEFKRAVQTRMLSTQNITIIEGDVSALVASAMAMTGVRLMDGSVVSAPAVVIATGTFLGARIFSGEHRWDGGRWSERSAGPLADQLEAVGIPLQRLKTGTPPRLDGRTIDWSRLERQPSDGEAWTMSATGKRVRPQIFCAATRTTRETHSIVAAGLVESPLFDGAISGRGPRYCPSIEDKVVRFADRESHQIFLEPEGADTHLVYPNGVSTSLGEATQRAMLRTVPGLERVEMALPGYAVEYGAVDPRILDHRLAVRGWMGLFLAGQINGTTGYEEAAGQGLVAGLNAAAFALGRVPIELPRDESYIGVMIDDLVLQGVTEPYRMLTARAENRLHLRSDNAEARLAPLALAAACLRPARQAALLANQNARGRVAELLASFGNVHPECVRDAVAGVPGLASEPSDIVAEQIADCRYRPYVERQRREHQRAVAEARPIKDDFDYRKISGLSNEMRERLEAARPKSTAEAQRINGITPAALAALWLAQVDVCD